MNNTTNMICVFLGGIAVGALGAVGIMNRMGYSKGGILPTEEDHNEEKTPKQELPMEDTPSFERPERINTQKVQYHMPEKPSLEELAKKYTAKGGFHDSTAQKAMAEREVPPEDLSVEDDEDEELQKGIAEALMDHPGQYEDEVFETDGFGHVIVQLISRRPTDLIYLVPEEYIGEIYPVEDLRWFEKDNVLVDNTDTPIDDPDHIIGSALEHFGDCGPQNAVFVRNCGIGYEYEVTIVESSYASYIYGVEDEDSTIPSKTGLHPAKARHKKRSEDEEE